MKVSREKMAENRARILTEACRLFQQKGFDGVTVSEVMRAAGLTHGGFYGHFQSKQDLVAQMLEHRCQKMQEAPASLEFFLETYLSQAICDDLAKGCHIPALAPEMTRQNPEAREAMTQSIRLQIGRLEGLSEDADPARRRGRAIRNWAALVGAVTLARASSDAALSEEILAEIRQMIREQADPPAPSARQ